MVWNLAVFCHLYATSLRFYIFLAYTFCQNFYWEEFKEKRYVIV